MDFSRVGFIGLGDIGLPMARRLLEHGLSVSSSVNRSRKPFDELKPLGLIERGSVREVAEHVNVLISMVVDDKQTDTVLRGENGAFAGLAQGSIVLVMSTLAPSYCQALAEDAAKKDIHLLDCPVTGGTIAAAKGTLGLSIGGDTAPIDRCKEILKPLGTMYHCGAVGMGQVAKLANNAAAFANIAALDEVRHMASAHGMDLSVLMQIMSHGTGQSFMTDKWDFIAENWSHLRPLGQKDVDLFIDASRQEGLTSRVIEAMNNGPWTVQSDKRVK